jgi:hypothetical protein
LAAEPTETAQQGLDPALWAEGGNDPVRLLGEVSAERLSELSADQGFVDWANRCRDRPRRSGSTSWASSIGNWRTACPRGT